MTSRWTGLRPEANSPTLLITSGQLTILAMLDEANRIPVAKNDFSPSISLFDQCDAISDAALKPLNHVPSANFLRSRYDSRFSRPDWLHVSKHEGMRWDAELKLKASTDGAEVLGSGHGEIR